MMDVQIISNKLKPDDLIHELENMPELQSSEAQLIIRKKEQAFRVLDPTVVVAIIAATSGGLGALITGALNIAKESKNKQIVIQDKEGRRMEISAGYSKEKIEELEEVLRRMEGASIELP